MVLIDNQAAKIIMKYLVPETAEDLYVAAPTEFVNKCDVLYAPHNPLSTFPPVFIEVQNQVDEKSLVRELHYNTLIYERYTKHPIVLVFGVASVTASFMSKTVEDGDYSFAKQMPALGWAKRCLFMSSATLGINKHNTEQELHHLQALGHFICSQAVSINTLNDEKNDQTIKLLYSIAHANLKQLRGEEHEKSEAIGSICDTTETQLQKIKTCIEKENKKALSYLDDTVDYLRRQKRKYCEMTDTTPIEETPPLVYLSKKSQSNSVELTEKLFECVEIGQNFSNI